MFHVTKIVVYNRIGQPLKLDGTRVSVTFGDYFTWLANQYVHSIHRNDAALFDRIVMVKVHSATINFHHMNCECHSSYLVFVIH